MKVSNVKELPESYCCKVCGQVKPVAEMIVIFRKSEKIYYLRPRCKACHNEKERGHRREYKRQYLEKWRRQNKSLNDSYWKDNDEVRLRAKVNAARRYSADGAALRIQGRLARKGHKITIEEARELLTKFGPCYPTRYGLTTKGLREFERIRSRLRSRAKRVPPAHEIRMMVYEDDDNYNLVIRPELQPEPYQFAAERLRQYHRRLAERNSSEISLR